LPIRRRLPTCPTNQGRQKFSFAVTTTTRPETTVALMVHGALEVTVALAPTPNLTRSFAEVAKKGAGFPAPLGCACLY